ncbi:hypothetical protein TNCV_4727471 [Trichonephila clavipes]|nr:hypothetical protein TNCV_4727471 [Trichonephila clavipes]
MLNPEQFVQFDAVIRVIQDVDEASPKAICVDVFVGSGKSFLLNFIIHSFRELGEIVAPVAWTEISANFGRR